MLRSLIVTGLFASLAACSASTMVPRTDFMPASVVLTPSGSDAERQTFRAADLDMSKYVSVNVLKVAMRVKLDDLKRAESLPAELRSNLQQFIGGVRSEGDSVGTLVVHAAITGARPDNPLADLGTNQASRAGGGYTAVEIYATAGANGPVVAAMTRTIYSHKLTLGSNAAWARTEKALQLAAEEFAKLLKPGTKFVEDN